MSGSDEDCLSLQDLQERRFEGNTTNSSGSGLSTPCRTIIHALGDVRCARSCDNPNPLRNAALKLSNGVHTLQRCVAILRGVNITIQAENSGLATVRCRELGSTQLFDNLACCETEGLTFRGIIFEGCGPLSSNVFIHRSNNVLFEDCTFQGNIGAPLRVQFVPSIRLVRTHFFNNHNQVPVPEDSKNTTIQEALNSITTSGGFTYFSNDTQVSIIIEECRFINNTGNSNENSTRLQVLSANGRGGGIVVRMADVVEAYINISGSLFEGNKVEIQGGAIHFSFTGTISTSKVHLLNNTFRRNTAQMGNGGAVSWNLIRSSFNNSYTIEDCNFTDNFARSSGAVSFNTYEANVHSFIHPDRARFIRCVFEGNKANVEATAVGLFALVHVEEYGFPVELCNCSFIGNVYNASPEAVPISGDHNSAFLAFRFPVQFNGFNYFSENFGGGIHLIGSKLDVSGRLLLERNVGVLGGGIAIDDSCLIELYPGVNITFAYNVATQSGGGIHVSQPIIRHAVNFFNRLCFMQYHSPPSVDIPPSEWEDVHVNFIGNRAVLSGAAIFASDIGVCSWIGVDYDKNITTIFGEQPQEIEELSPFYYRDNVLLEADASSQVDKDLATEPVKISANLVDATVRIVQPGEILSIDILATDEVGNKREAVWSLQAPDQDSVLDATSAGNEVTMYTIPPANSLLSDLQNCSADSNITGQFSLIFSLSRTLTNATTLTFELDGCHPGYYFDSASCRCLCSDSRKDRILRCETQSQRYIYLQSGIWGGVDNSSGQRCLVTARAPAHYLNCNRSREGSGCLFKWDDETAQCVNGRHGHLCGQCREGYAITLDLQRCHRLITRDCTVGLLVFLFYCVVVVVGSFLILFFNIGLANEVKGLFFYLQVIGLVFKPYITLDPSLNTVFAGILFTVLNLFGLSLPLPVCVYNVSLQAHHAALLSYVTPLLILATTVTYAICTRYINKLSNKSALEGITLLSLFCYKYLADSSVTLVSCTETDVGWLFVYNGAVKCFQSAYLAVFILALFVGIIPMLVFPFGVVYVCVKRPVKMQQYADILTKGLRLKHRWFGGWDVGRRLPFIIISLITVRPSVVVLLMVVAALLVLLVHLLVQPYQQRHVNIIESLVLLNLVVVTIIYLNPLVSGVPIWLSTILLLTPYLYGVLYLAWVIGHKCCYKKYLESRHKDDDVDNFFLKERSIGVGHKKRLSLGSFRNISFKVRSVHEDEPDPLRQSFLKLQDPPITVEFTEYRETLLNDITNDHESHISSMSN